MDINKCISRKEMIEVWELILKYVCNMYFWKWNIEMLEFLFFLGII